MQGYHLGNKIHHAQLHCVIFVEVQSFSLLNNPSCIPMVLIPPFWCLYNGILDGQNESAMIHGHTRNKFASSEKATIFNIRLAKKDEWVDLLMAT